MVEGSIDIKGANVHTARWDTGREPVDILGIHEFICKVGKGRANQGMCHQWGGIF